MFVIEQDGAAIQGPTGWTPRLAEACGLRGNANPPARPFDLGGGRTLRDVAVSSAAPDAFQTVIDDGGALDGDVWRITQSAVDLPLDRAKGGARAHWAAHRYAVETGGTTVSGMAVATDRDSQGLIVGAAFAASLDAQYTVQWKTAAGFVTLDAATMIALAQAVRAHVQAAFDREAEIAALIDAAETVDDLRAIAWEAA